MIEKNDLLDAYQALIGSDITNIAILIAVLIGGYPSDLPDENIYKSECEYFYIFSVANHGLAVIWFIGMRFQAFRESRTKDVIGNLQVLLHIYSIGVAFALFIGL